MSESTDREDLAELEKLHAFYEDMEADIPQKSLAELKAEKDQLLIWKEKATDAQKIELFDRLICNVIMHNHIAQIPLIKNGILEYAAKVLEAIE